MTDQIAVSSTFADLAYSGWGVSYSYSGQLGVYLDVLDLDEEGCETSWKCTFGAVFDVAGTVSDLPDIGTGTPPPCRRRRPRGPTASR